jgi:small subunit ribosomal protein S1
MSNEGDFASLMESGASNQKVSRKLRSGEVVEGIVVQIGHDSVFVDVGAMAEARIDRTEFEGRDGKLTVAVGDKVRASVLSTNDLSGPVLSVSLGKGQLKGTLDVSALESARDGAIPVTGTVQRAVKGGLEVLVGGVRAFCPASQVDAGYIADLSSFDGQSLSFRVVEVKDGGRSVVLSRKALMEEERKLEAQQVLERLRVGDDYEGTVNTIQKYGAFVDLGGGVEGLVHVSELAHSRVDRVEDVLSVGEKVTVRLLALEPADKGPIPKLRLSLKAREAAPQLPRVHVGEILTGTVSKLASFGVFVDTPKGNGLVPVRELGVPRGADFRKQFPIGKEVRVVFVNREDSGKTTFSIERVAGVEERQNYSDFSARDKPSEEPEAVGSFGALLQKKLGIKPSPAAFTPKPTPKAAAAAQPEAPAAAQPEAPAAPPRFFQREVGPKDSPNKQPPPGMFRRKS